MLRSDKLVPTTIPLHYRPLSPPPASILIIIIAIHCPPTPSYRDRSDTRVSLPDDAQITLTPTFHPALSLPHHTPVVKMMNGRHSPPPTTNHHRYHDPRDRISDTKPLLLSDSPATSPTSSPTLRPAGTLTAPIGRSVHFSLNGAPAGQSPVGSALLPWWARAVVPVLFVCVLATFGCLAWVVSQGTTGGGGYSVGWRGLPYGAVATPHSRLFRATSAASSPCPADSLSAPTSPYRPSPLLKPLPEHRALIPSVCGSGLADYQRLHASISSPTYFTSHFLQHQSFPVPQLLVFLHRHALHHGRHQ